MRTADRFCMGIDILAMTVSHLDAVVAIETALFKDPWSRTMFFSDLGTDYGYSIIAADSGMTAGYLNAWIVRDECTINRIACAPDRQRRGIASMMLDRLIHAAVQRSVKNFLLEVRSGNMAAQCFYKKAGFTETGIRKSYYTDTHEDALLMHMAAPTVQQVLR